MKIEQVIAELVPVMRGWLNYFRYARCKSVLKNLDSWIRRKLRCYRLKQCKRVITLQRFLERQGVESWQSWIIALSGKGHWCKSGCPQAHQALNNKWFDAVGRVSKKTPYFFKIQFCSEPVISTFPWNYQNGRYFSKKCAIKLSSNLILFAVRHTSPHILEKYSDCERFSFSSSLPESFFPGLSHELCPDTMQVVGTYTQTHVSFEVRVTLVGASV